LNPNPGERLAEDQYMKTVVGKILTFVETAEGTICAIGLFITSVLIFAQVVNRYFLHFEIMWFSDLALFVFIFFMLVAAAYATWREGHVSVDFLRDRVVRGRPVRAAVYRVVLDVLSLMALCAILPAAYRFMKRAIQYPEYATLVRWFNTSWLQMTLFVALVLVLLHLTVILRRDMGELYRQVLQRHEREKA
jgi:TRAP-type C4-dicarboxylate transport system permease small subunit